MSGAMFVRELGSGPTVLALHGTPSPAEDFMPLAERLASKYRVLVPDLPGYGKSPAPADASYEVVDATVARLVGGQRLHAIIGFSSGGYRALEMVLRRRVETDLVIGLGAFATFDQPNREMRRQLGDALDQNPQFLYGPEIRDMFRQLMLSPSWADTHPADLERIYQWVQVTPPAALAAEARAMADIPDLLGELPGIPARLYLRVGELDLGAPPAVSQEIARLVPRASIDVVRGCGHTLLIEDLEGTISAIVHELEA